MIEFSIPLAPMAKARPRVTSRGTYMPHDYTKWKRDFGVCCHGVGSLVPGPFELHARFVTKTGRMRPDLDNCLGAVLDALQDAGVILNDRHAVKLSAAVVAGEGPVIEIQLGEVVR